MAGASWSRAFALQACADFEAREALLRTNLPPCQQLHFLQMAMEKVAKAHLIAGGSDPSTLQSSHAYVEKVIPNIVKMGLGRSGDSRSLWIMKAIRALARRVELLHPQVDAAGSVPANCEYPWQGPNGVIAPVEFEFDIRHDERAFVTMVKEAWSRALELSEE